MRNHKNNLTAIIALLIIPLSGMATDIYVPSLPALTHYFNTTQYLSQFTVTSYLLGYSVSQLFSGVVVDIVGTKKVSVITLFIFTLLNILIIFSANIYYTCVFRVIQGCAVGFFAVAQRAIMPNLFKHDHVKMHNMTNYAMITWSLGPIVAPALGGYLQHFWGWKFSFIFLALYAFCMMIFVVSLTDEAIERRCKLNISLLKISYSTILSNKVFIINILCLSCIYSISILFSTVGSFIIQKGMNYNSIFFGYCSLAMGVSWFIGSIANKLIRKIDGYKKIMYSLKIMILLYIMAISLNICINGGVYLFISFIIISNIFAGMIFSNYYATNLIMFPLYAGNAAGLMSSGLIFITAIISAIFNKFIEHHQVMMLLAANLLLVIICYLITVTSLPKRDHYQQAHIRK